MVRFKGELKSRGRVNSVIIDLIIIELQKLQM